MEEVDDLVTLDLLLEPDDEVLLLLLFRERCVDELFPEVVFDEDLLDELLFRLVACWWVACWRHLARRFLNQTCKQSDTKSIFSENL